ncbi:hypothetical protein V8E54_011892 [Elaphomyces granulatus]
MSESSPDVQHEDDEPGNFSREFEAIAGDSSNVDLGDINWADSPPRRLPCKPSWSDLWPSAAIGIQVDQGTVDPKKLIKSPPASTLPIGDVDENPPTNPSSDPPSPRSDLAAGTSAVDPSAVDTSVVDPSAADPSAADPSAADPSAADPSAADPSVADPSAAADGPEEAAQEEENPHNLRRSRRSRRPPNWLGEWVLE